MHELLAQNHFSGDNLHQKYTCTCGSPQRTGRFLLSEKCVNRVKQTIETSKMTHNEKCVKHRKKNIQKAAL